jgi:hypothetical protein
MLAGGRVRGFNTHRVTIIRGHGTQTEERLEVRGHIQPDTGFFDVKTPIREGDVVEVADPRGGVRTMSVAQVKIYDAG